MPKNDYDPFFDEGVLRKHFKEAFNQEPVRDYEIEKPLYDISRDAYWLVRRTRTGYRFTGPISLARYTVDLLPSMTEFERRDALRHIPRQFTDAPYGIEIEQLAEPENDGA